MTDANPEWDKLSQVKNEHPANRLRFSLHVQRKPNPQAQLGLAQRIGMGPPAGDGDEASAIAFGAAPREVT